MSGTRTLQRRSRSLKFTQVQSTRLDSCFSPRCPTFINPPDLGDHCRFRVHLNRASSRPQITSSPCLLATLGHPISSPKLASPLRSVFARHFTSFKLAPQNRLSLISRHLDHRPQLELNTPFTTERLSSPADDLPYSPARHFSTTPPTKHNKQTTMSTQAPHPALLIPGPIEFDDEVLQSMSHYR